MVPSARQSITTFFAPLVTYRRRRSGARRFLTALLVLLLLLAVPVISAYVAYKLTLGENLLEWPPTVDYDRIFGP